MDVKGVIWDVDGTLLDTICDIAGALNRTLRAWGLPEKGVRETVDGIGHGARYLCAWGSGLEGVELDRFTAMYRQAGLELEEPATVPFEGIRDLIGRLVSSGVRVGVYTNKPQAWTDQLLGRFFGTGVFGPVIGTIPGGPLKPSREGIDSICSDWGVGAGDVVMVGDSEVDWQTAVNAGCRSAIVSWGYGDRDRLASLGVGLVTDVPELARVLGL